MIWWKRAALNTPMNLEGSPELNSSVGVTVTGAGVSQWIDPIITDAGKIFAQGTDAKRPVYSASDADFKGQASLSLSGEQRLLSGDWAVALAVPFTDVFVLKLPNPIVAAKYFADANKAGGGSISLLTGTGTLKAYAGAMLETPALTAGSVVIVAVEYSGVTSKIHVDDAVTPSVSGTTGGIASSTGRSLGGSFGDGYTPAGSKIAYYKHFQRKLTEAQRVQLFSQLAAKYKP